MKKFFSNLMVCFAILAVFVVRGFAVTGGSVGGIPERAQWGATHVVEVTYADLAKQATSNSVLTLTNALSIAAGETCQMVTYVLDTAFVGASHTNAYTNSIALTVTDAGGTNNIMGSTEIHADSTEVWAKSGLIQSTVTYLSALSTNTAGISVVTTSSLSAVTMPVGNKYYSAANFVNLTFTPNDTPDALSATTSGKLRLFFRKVKSKD